MSVLSPNSVQASTGTSGQPDAYTLFVPYPSNVPFAAVSCAINGGNIEITRADETGNVNRLIRPDSPAYNLTNSACSGNCVLSLAGLKSGNSIVAITYSNNQQAESQATTIVTLAYQSTVNQTVGAFECKVPAGRSVSVTIIFARVDVAEPAA